jgi:RNA polymerase sigma-70 factor (ECF subfamily)
VTVAETVVRGSLSVTQIRSKDAVDAETLTRLFRTHAATTHRFLLRMGVSLSDVDDVLQRVFMVVWHKLDTLREDASERAWVLAIARREAANHRRKRRREPPRIATVDPVTPEDQASGREAARLVRQFMDELDEPRRLVFHLADVEGMTAPEISEATDTNVNTVYTRLRAARRAFREFVSTRLEGADNV